MDKIPEKLPLDRLLAGLNYGTRREVRGLIEAGRVTVGGAEVGEVRRSVTRADVIAVDGEALDPWPGTVLLMHKPAGTVCSHKETGRRVYDLLPIRWRDRDPPFSTVGRLDADTTGALLLTDDGVLLHRLTSPKHGIDKVYRVELEEDLTADAVAQLERGGLMLQNDDKPLLPARVAVLGPRLISLTLQEGRYHQVKRMIAAVDGIVTRLHRLSIGPIDAEALEPGSWIVLEGERRAALMQAVGLG